MSADFFESFLGIMDFLLAQIPNGHVKTVAANVLSAERRRCPAEIFDAQSSLLESPLGAVKDGEVLNGEGVTILEAAEPDAFPLDFPTAPNELQSVERVQVPLLQPVKSERAGFLWPNVGQFLNLKILRPLFDLHAVSVRDSARALRSPTRRFRKSPGV